MQSSRKFVKETEKKKRGRMECVHPSTSARYIQFVRDGNRYLAVSLPIESGRLSGVFGTEGQPSGHLPKCRLPNSATR